MQGMPNVKFGKKMLSSEIIVNIFLTIPAVPIYILSVFQTEYNKPKITKIKI